MKTDEIRDRFLRFFEKRGHKIIPSDSLIPHNDPTLLFTGAGMNQFKEEFLGFKPAAFRRAASCQKCLRTADIDNVGVTRWHMTFFEMLGNFSFGDYFKREACQWAWQFMLEEMGRKPEDLWITIYEDDEESFEIWNKRIGVSEERIWRFGEDENFWPESAPSKGPNGPCGPCTEILVDTGVPTVDDSTPATDPGRFVEVWNLVLQQFDRQEGGRMEPLSSKNIDTGMGLERMAAIMQGAPTALDIDIMLPLVEAAAERTGRDYAPGMHDEISQRLRRIAEHVRAIAFCIADGALPDRGGRGYVVRKLIRRAAINGRMLDVHEPFLYELVPVVEEQMAGVYPELAQRRTIIENILKQEEERFVAAISEDSPGTQGFKKRLADELGLSEETRKATTYGDPRTLAPIMFEAYDTHGVPLEYMEEVLGQEHVVCDREALERTFEGMMEGQRAQSRAGSRMGGEAIVFKREFLSEQALDRLRRENLETDFIGHESIETEARVLAIFVGDEWVDSAEAGQQAQVLLDRTPFYARSGGQVGDVGRLESKGGEATVSDTILDHSLIVHLVTVEKGRIKRRKRVRAAVDVQKRLAIARNHTATHLLQWALRASVGEHVHQAGSEVSPERLRFDFTHPVALSPDERRRVERLVNDRILEAAPVKIETMPLKEARNRGAMALFGEKYANRVRVVSVGNFSMELCGGTHLDTAARVGLFKITGEESIAAGVRRITAVTGLEALDYLHQEENRITEACAALKATPETMLARIENLQKQIKDLRNELTKARSVSKRGGVDELLEQVRDVEGVPVLAAEVEGADQNALREACDVIRRKQDSVLVVLGSREGEKVSLVAAATNDLVEKGLHAGNIVREVAKEVGGGGGGRPDLGQAGGKNPDALPAALEKVPDLVRAQLGGAT
ncbi:MAG TPA: alanine--tRNA ligase [Phycisphaerae bacterium]|nr:alanine--tRNA ligase [Phycisphaerae bacterium]